MMFAVREKEKGKTKKALGDAQLKKERQEAGSNSWGKVRSAEMWKSPMKALCDTRREEDGRR